MTVPFASRAETRTENAVPACFDEADKAVVPPVIVTANCVTVPNGVDETPVELVPVPPPLPTAATRNQYVPGVRPVIVKLVALDVVWVVVADEKSDVIECWIEYLAIVCPAV